MTLWDPIGVNGVPEAADEYDNYMGHIQKLVELNASDEWIVRHLRDLEVNAMGLPPSSEEKLMRVANALRCIMGA